MKKKLLSKCLVALGLLLFFTLPIPFTAYNTVTAQAGVIDKEKSDSYLLMKSITLVKGKSKTLKVCNTSDNAKITYKSDDAEVASVSDNGIVTANKVGVAIITVTIKEGSNITSLPCDVTVGPPALSVKLTKSRIILGVNASDTLRVILKPSNTTEEAKFTSSDNTIVYVSTGGRITAKKEGFARIFAVIEAPFADGLAKFAPCSVIVTSVEDAPLLDTYFTDHPELNLIPENDMVKALDDFFNGKLERTTSSSKIVEVSKSTMVNNLNHYLDNLFDLDDLRATYDASLAKSTQAEVSDNSSK